MNFLRIIWFVIFGKRGARLYINRRAGKTPDGWKKLKPVLVIKKA
jgi:hypothetical protein